jgi:hypothetical protein
VFNIVGNVLSDTASFIFASIPPAPSTPPQDDPLLTSSTQIGVTYSAITSQDESGGAPILSYNLQMDDSNGHFTTITN